MAELTDWQKRRQVNAPKPKPKPKAKKKKAVDTSTGEAG